MSQVITGEAVALDLRVARLGSRGLAALLDWIIEFAALLLFAAMLPNDVDTGTGAAISILLFAALTVGYPVAFESLWHGRTPGKAALGLRVVRDDGGPIRFRHALTRGLLNIVERPGITLGSAAVVASLASRRGKRLGDLVAGTVVLQERVPTMVQPPVLMPAPLAGWARTLDLSRLPDDLALRARDFLARAAQLTPEARDQLGRSLTTAVVSVVTPPPPPGTPGWAYLAAVLAERRRRDEVRLRTEAQQRTVASGQPATAGWQPPPPTPGWGPSPATPWSASAPATGAPPADPGSPTLPAPPAPSHGPAPVPPSEPPEGPFAPPS